MMRAMAASLARACNGGGSFRGAGAAAAAASAAAVAPPPLPRRRRFCGLGSHTSDNDPDVLEREKKRNLSGETAKEGGAALPGSVPGTDGWNPRLASDSEEVVKAERATVSSVEEMVEISLRQVEKARASEEAEEAKGRGEEQHEEAKQGKEAGGK